MAAWIPLLVLLAAIATSSTSRATTDMITAINTTKPGCQRQCGNLTVPYPFGIGRGNGCSIGESYDIQCLTSFTPPRPFLGTTGIEIFDISETHIKIKNNVAESCLAQLGDSKTIELKSSDPFTLSETSNAFFATGCDSLAMIQGTKGTNITSGCLTVCSRKEDVIGGTCSGIGCCKTAIPKGLKGYMVLVSSLDQHTKVSDFSPCSQAFVGEIGGFNFQGVADFIDPTFVNRTTNNVAVVLDWNVGNTSTCSQAKRNLSGYACQQNTNCTDVDLGSGGYRCSCLPGFEGNPYLSPGCTDVDECKSLRNPCVHKNTCNNKIGDYHCSCPNGQKGDGRINGTRCDSTNSQLAMKIGLGTSVALSLLFICLSWTYFTVRKRKLIKMREKFFEQNGGLLLKQQLGPNQAHNESTKIFSSAELKSATNNYSEDRILGKGGYGTVYKGVLPDNRVVAIKKSKVSDQTQIEQFINEVVILTQVNHRNVVKLLGCCLETEVPLLVYEFISNGTLFDHIHSKGKTSWLTWSNCVKIASEAADALSYLHSAANIPVIHWDIKSANILIDDTYDAKVADFGASRLIPLDQAQVSTMVQGTLGYLDPEYLLTSQLTGKSDVYSFGVLLAELLTREKPFYGERKTEERTLASYFLVAMKEDRVMEIVHDDLKREADREQLLYMARLIRSCLSINGNDRPTMKEVAMELEGLKKHAKHPWADKSHDESTSFTTQAQEDLYPISSNSQGMMVDLEEYNNSIKMDTLMKMNHPR